MRVQTEEWRRFIPGVRMYKGKKTLFYNGEKLSWWNESLDYNQEERESWEVIIILPGVEVIPWGTFLCCKNVKTVIMSDTVKRIENMAFQLCTSLSYVRLSTNLEYIGQLSFQFCSSLTSIFIPPTCREIGDCAFQWCPKLIILAVPQHTQLGEKVIAITALIRASPIETNWIGGYENTSDEVVNEWIKNRHAENEFILHRACSSYNPLDEVIFDIIKRQGLKAFKRPDSIGVTASQYLSENPFAEIEEQKIIKHYILDMVGESTLDGNRSDNIQEHQDSDRVAQINVSNSVDSTESIDFASDLHTQPLAVLDLSIEITEEEITKSVASASTKTQKERSMKSKHQQQLSSSNNDLHKKQVIVENTTGTTINSPQSERKKTNENQPSTVITNVRSTLPTSNKEKDKTAVSKGKKRKKSPRKVSSKSKRKTAITREDWEAGKQIRFSDITKSTSKVSKKKEEKDDSNDAFDLLDMMNQF
ncbi:leucine-rich repeat domain-containing protein [Chaetoceros tenuissimus]|uniref:Leucine-rich repeat domain-containing protein n=1 Tax=Chaetoceros tenuissimus TaxID=426638 RepID=A0AAD3CMM7_9STRA|nr:leucine-rich repeat domain-containing protein [Chaetoceros tenuissimus]